MKLRLPTFDLLKRWRVLASVRQAYGLSFWAVVLSSVVLQTLAHFVPFLASLTWPLLIYVACRLWLNQTVPTSALPRAWLGEMGSLFTRPTILISLLLYGMLSFIIYWTLTEVLMRLPLAKGVAFLHLPILAVFPYAFSEAVVMLFAASCAYRLVLDDRDVFALLSTAARDLLFSPVSCLALCLLYALVWTDIVTSIAIAFKAPLLSALLGHSVFSFIAILWAAGGLSMNACTDTPETAFKTA